MGPCTRRPAARSASIAHKAARGVTRAPRCPAATFACSAAAPAARKLHDRPGARRPLAIRSRRPPPMAARESRGRSPVPQSGFPPRVAALGMLPADRRVRTLRSRSDSGIPGPWVLDDELDLLGFVSHVTRPPAPAVAARVVDQVAQHARTACYGQQRRSRASPWVWHVIRGPLSSPQPIPQRNSHECRARLTRALCRAQELLHVSPIIRSIGRTMSLSISSRVASSPTARSAADSRHGRLRSCDTAASACERRFPGCASGPAASVERSAAAGPPRPARAPAKAG